MEKKIRFGLLGLGRGRVPLINLNHLSDYVTVVGVVEQNPATIQEVKDNGQLKPETPVFDTFDDLLAAGLDAVILCDYFHTHYKFAIQALDAGVAVFSETTAAPSLGACVDLVEAVERNNGKYMLMANCPYFMALQLAKKKMKENEYGDLVYAEAEYVHPVDPATVSLPNPEKLHWRNTLPSCYYNMHSLGPLMYVTNSVPKKVLAKAAVKDIRHKITNAPKIYTLTEMDNGTLFNTTGCVNVGTVAKWYRFAFERGSIETKRLEEASKTLLCAGIDAKTAEELIPTWDSCGAVSAEDLEKYGDMIANGGHGGSDSILFLDMIKYLRDGVEPFFNVYRSVALSATGILSWYSVLNGSKEYNIPDFSKKEERDRVRSDYRMPFADRLDELTLPHRVAEPVK